MQFDKLDLEDVWIGKSQPLIDIRGSFREWFKLDEFTELVVRSYEKMYG